MTTLLRYLAIATTFVMVCSSASSQSLISPTSSINELLVQREVLGRQIRTIEADRTRAKNREAEIQRKISNLEVLKASPNIKLSFDLNRLSQVEAHLNELEGAKDNFNTFESIAQSVALQLENMSPAVRLSATYF